MTAITINNSDPIQQLAKRLKTIDEKLSRELKNFVPDWWDEELNNSPGAVQQLFISLARFINLDLKSVLDETQSLRFKESICNYKHASNKEQFQLKTATALVASIARTAAQTNIQEYKPIPDALLLRKNLLDAGNPCVNFQALVCYCWQQGIPVLYLPELPATKKMDAVVVDINDNPVIAITKKCKHESEFLFLLAHEMGHIFHQHLKTGQLLIDEKIRETIEIDRQEKQANDFAISLLTGQSKTRYDWNINNPRSLKLKVEQESRVNKIDAGHILLNWGYTTKKFPFAIKILNTFFLTPNWPSLLKEQLLNNIDFDKVQGDQLDYVYKLMKIED